MELSRSGLIAITLAVLGFGLAPATAGAHDRWPAPGDFYVELGGGVEWVNLPELTAFNTNGREFGAIDDEFRRWTAEVALGYADPDGLSLPDPIGENARIEGRVRYARGTSDTSVVSSNAPLLMRYVDDPSGFADALINADAQFNTMLESWDASLTYQTDVVLSTHLALSPLIGLTYSRLRFANDYKGVHEPSGTFMELNDHTRTHYYGGVLGVDVTVRPVEELQIVLGLRGDLMGASASMFADQDTFLFERSESDNDTNFAGRGTASLGFTLSLGPLTLGAEGYASYLSYLAVADHPINAMERASNIDGKEMWSAGARGYLTIWFP